MKIEIYEHNKKAFENVLEAFKTTNRTCVVHPTGSGKMFVALQLMDKFKDKHIAYLTSYISIIDKLISDMKKIGVEVPNLNTQIYGNLNPISELDYIILDEFHHAGAPVWGAKLQELLSLNPNAKVLGLSATPIRYLDNNRDMAEELFDGNVASYMGLGEAIGKGILKLPKYINAMYNFDGVIKTYEARIAKIKNLKKQNEARELLEKAKRMLENSDGLPEIMEKHITNKNGRYIVFCKDFEHLDLMVKECTSWMRKVNKNINIYVIKSTIDKDINRNSLHDFEHNTDDSLKLLFCVDMLNEGIHVKNDGCIMLRPTESYNVYLQQLGRVLAVSNSEATIFDIVNNSENLTMVSELKEIIRASSSGRSDKDSYIDNFEIVENLRNFIEITNIIDDIINNIGWDVGYDLAKDYYEEYGDLLIPQDYIIDNMMIGLWISDQRRKYKNNILSQEKIDLLESIGMIWDHFDNKWSSSFNLAKDYYKEHGNLLIPNNYIVDGVNLSSWIHTQRKKYKNNILSQEKIDLLESIDMIWDPHTTKWSSSFNLAKDYYEEHGNLLVPFNYTVDDVNLSSWIHSQRQDYKNSKLSKERINLLESIGMVWDPIGDRWSFSFNLAKDYYKEHGNLSIPRNYTINGINLGNWIGIQRKSYKNNILSQERINLLESIGMIWDTIDNKWSSSFNLAKDYYEEHGNLLVPFNYTVDDVNLGNWIGMQRKSYKNNILSPERIDLLESIGMVWDPIGDRWSFSFNLAKDYYKEHGNLLIPSNYIVDSINLSIWLSAQRSNYKNSKLSQEKIELLESIGMVWDVNESQWYSIYELAKDYYKEHRSLLIPQKYIINGIKLGSWLCRQRKLYKTSKLSKDKIELLNSINMVWNPKNK